MLLLPRVADSLAGRMEVIPLWPFSQGELEGAREHFIDAVFGSTPLKLDTIAHRDEHRQIQQRVLRGGFPEVQTRATEERRKAWFGSFLTTILQRDARDLSQMEDLTAMPRLLAILASRAGSLLTTADISRSSGVAQTTLKRYLSLLETLLLFKQLPAWSSNVGTRYVKMAKALVTDTGLAAHLLHLTAERLSEESGAWGLLLENFVAMELGKATAWSQERPELFHWRTHGQQEVDLVLAAGGRLVGIAVKASTTVTTHDFKGLKALAAEAGSRWVRGVVLYTDAELLPFGDQLAAMPVSSLWRLGAR